MEQLSLFDTIQEPKIEKNEEPKVDVGDWCLVYLVTFSGGNKGNLFVLHELDAIKLCSDECSHGIARGGKWMFNWTSLKHFDGRGGTESAEQQFRNVHQKLEPFVFIRDTGKQDADFERLGIDKPDIKEIEQILESIGYRMEYKGEQSTKDRIEKGESCLTFKELEQTRKELKTKGVTV